MNEIIYGSIDKIIARNTRVHAEIRRIIDKFTFFSQQNRLLLSKAVVRLLNEKTWASRGDPIWWTPEERKWAGIEDAKLQNCIQCSIREALVQERDSPHRIFCGSYCQLLHHHKGIPDFRGMSLAQVKERLQNLKMLTL